MQRIETLRVLRFRREIAAYARFSALTATSVCVSRRNSVKTHIGDGDLSREQMAQRTSGRAGRQYFREQSRPRRSPRVEAFARGRAICRAGRRTLKFDGGRAARRQATQIYLADGQRLDLDQSVQHIQKQYPDFRRDWIEEYLIDWIDMDHAPEHYSEAQLDELDKLTARWIADHVRRAKISKRQERTRHS